jgi:hypothetical protein
MMRYTHGMLGNAIREKLTSKEFRPFTLVLASGERIEVQHPDSVSLSSVEFRGKRFFASYLNVLETRGDEVIERSISLPMVAQVLETHRMNGAA